MIPWVREKFAERRAKWKTRNDQNVVPSGSQNTSSHRDDRQICSTSKFRSSNTSNSSHENRKDGESAQKDKIKLRILSPNARSIQILTSINKKLIDLKHEALIEFAEDSAALPLFASDVKQLIPKYRFVRPDADATTSNLNESLTLAQLNMLDNETLILNVRRGHSLSSRNRSFLEIRRPTYDEIDEATRNLPFIESTAEAVNINDLILQSDSQFDVRKVLISLAQTSAYIIGSGPYATRLISMLRHKIKNKHKYQTDTIQCLIDMGFPRDRAKYALQKFDGVYANALEWLIQNQNEIFTINDQNFSIASISPSNSSQSENIMENIESLLKIVKTYSHRDLQPSVTMVNNLKQMGFCEKDILDALRRTHNNQTAACEWLCGNRNSSLMELRDGLSQESPILKAVLDSAQIQASLSNPKIFLAYLSMLENHNALSMWLGDNDTSAVISHILRKYHEEKHILGINQFNTSNVR